MDYIQIKRFLMIVKHLNLSEAAKELYITQPALSLSLSNMEKELGLKLFFRVRNGLILTPEGEKLLRNFEQVNDAFEQLYETKEKLQQPRESELHLGCEEKSLLYATLSMGNLLNVDGITVKTICADRETTVAMLKSGQLDFAIAFHTIEDRAIGNINLYREDIAIVTSKKHRLAMRDGLKLSDLQDEKLYGLTKQHSFRTLCDQLCSQKGYRLHYKKEQNTFDFYKTIEQHRDADDYVAFCAWDSYDTMYGEGYVRHPILEVDFMQSTYLSFVADRKMQFCYENFVNHLVKHYPEQRKLHDTVFGYIANGYINQI